MQQCVVFPIVRVGIHHHALHRRRGVVTFETRSIAAVILGNNKAAPVWVKKNLGETKPQAVAGVRWPLHPIGVKLSRLHARHERVPVIVGTAGRGIDRNDARGPGIILPVKA